MDRVEYQLARELFHELAEQAPDQQRAFLRDQELAPPVRAYLEQLLNYQPTPDPDLDGGRMVRDALNSAFGPSDGSTVRQIGVYEVLGKIGEGGMGIVYAGRKEGTDTVVALKLIRPMFAAPEAVKRFAREGRILRRLNHDCIAAYFDSGEARITVGMESMVLPFLAMELVDGVPIVKHAASRRLSARDRVELIARICDALQHAHELGVVHRDLKPGNILVVASDDDPMGTPKLLDFGVARAAGADLQTMTATQSGALVGTLPYMSPEQVSGGQIAVDERSDVYSLGVLLFELLSGRLPYAVQGKPLHEAARVIREEDPTRLGSVVADLRGALELIVSKTLEKDPSRRYASAAALATDLRNYLAGRKVEARPARWSHQVGKFARQHKVLVGTVCGTTLALAVGLVTTLWFAFGEADARRAAEEAARASRWLAYRMGIDGASADLVRYDVAGAFGRLEQVPAEFIGWEWHHLRSRIDQSLHRIEVDVEVLAAETAQLAFSPGGDEVYVADPGFDGAVLVTASLTDGSVKTRSIPGVRWLAIDPSGQRFYHQDPESGALRLEDAEGNESSLVQLAPGASYWASTDPTRLLAREGEQWFFLDVEEGREPARVPIDSTGAHPGGFSRGSLAANGARFAWARNGRVYAWGRSDQERWEVDAQGNLITAVLSPTGRYLAAFSELDRTIETWELTPGLPPAPLCFFEEHLDEVKTLAFAGDSGLVASGGEDSMVRLWDVRTGKQRQLLPYLGRDVHRLAFSREADRLAALIEREDGFEVVVWSVRDQDGRAIGHDQMLRAVEYSQGGDHIAVRSEYSLHLYDSATGHELARYDDLPGAEASMDLSPDGRWIATGGRRWDQVAVEVIDKLSGERRSLIRRSVKGRNYEVSFSPAGDRLATFVDAGEGVVLWNTSDWTRVAEQRVAVLQSEPVRVQFGPRSGRLALSGGDPDTAESVIFLLDAETLDIEATLRSDGGPVLAMGFDPDGDHLVTGGRDGTVRIWDLQHLGRSQVVPSGVRNVFSLAHSPDGRRLAVGGRSRSFGLWSTDDYSTITSLHGHNDAIRGVAFSPDGKSLVSASGDRVLRIWGHESASDRSRKRREYRETRARLEPFVRELVAELGPVRAAERLRGEESLSARGRVIAVQILMGLVSERDRPHPAEPGGAEAVEAGRGE